MTATPTELRHGYALTDIDQLARVAVSRCRAAGWSSAADNDELYTIAWDAIARRLYTADERPAGHELIGAAFTELSTESDHYRRHHGYRDNQRAFGVYWLDLAAPTRSHESGIVDRAALAQIWPQLQPYMQRAFTALATFESYQAAADALGLSYKTFASTVSQARREFLRLWHEGEEPSRPWGNDRRRSEGTRRNATTRHVKYRKGRQKVEPVHGKASTYRNHKCRCVPCREAIRVQAAEYRARKTVAA